MKLLAAFYLAIICFGCVRDSPSAPGETSLPVADATSSEAHPEDAMKIERWVQELGSDDAEKRRTAAYELGQNGSSLAVPHLIAALDDADLQVRIYAIQSLRDLRDPLAVQPLCELLEKQSAEPLIVSNIMRALGAIRSNQALPTLLEALRSDDPFTRYDAAFALGEIGDPSAIPALEKLSTDTTMPERAAGQGGAQSTVYSVGEQAQRAIELLRTR